MGKRQTRVTKAQKKAQPVCPLEQKLVRQLEQAYVQAVASQVVYRRTQVNRDELTPADLLALQRTVGNHRVQRLIRHQREHSHNKLQLQALPIPVRPPVRPPLRSIPGGRTSPGMGRPLRIPEGYPRYAPDPMDDSLEAAFARADIRAYAERVRMEQERPIATLERGGQAPGFITDHGTRQYSWIGGVGGGGSVTVRNRRFHVLDAIERDVEEATNEEQLQAIVERYFPMVGIVNQAIEIARRSHPPGMPGIRFLPLWDEPIYPQGFDPGARVRLQLFERATRRRAQTVPALARSRLIPESQTRRGCRIEPISPLGDDPLSVLYCHMATGSPFSYKITIESATGGLTRRWAEIDALRGNTWYECKCGYEALLTGAARGAGVARAVLDKLDRQVLNHMHIARTCGLEYRYIVSNERVAEILRNRWFGNVTINVVPFESCN